MAGTRVTAPTNPAVSPGLAAPSLIKKAGPLPYYAQLAKILRAQIRSATFGPGDALPSEGDLCSTYGLSRTAVRQALNELVAEGLVEKSKGRGTFVAQPRMAAFVVQELRGFFDEMGTKGFAVYTEILRCEASSASLEISTALGLETDQKTVLIDRVRGANGIPIVHVQTHLPLQRFGALIEMDLADKSLYRLLEKDFSVQPHVGRREIAAVAASRETADQLQLEIGAPMLQLTAVNLDQEGEPFEFFRAWYRGDLATFDLAAHSAASTA